MESNAALCRNRRACGGHRAGTLWVVVWVGVCVGMFCTPHSAFAQPNPQSAPAQHPPNTPSLHTPPLEMGLWSTLAAMVPGAFVHGLGHAVGGDTETAWDLALLEGCGAAMMLIGAGMTGPTGASRNLIGIAYPTGLAGFALFTGSWIADIYGSATGGRDATGTPHVPTILVQSGLMHVRDHQFTYTNFATLSADLRISHWRMAPSFWRALDDDNTRTSALFAFRVDGPRPRHAARDASYIDLVQTLSWHDFASDGFNVATLTFEVDTRYDLHRLSPTLQGSFADMSLGYGMEMFGYDAPGLSFGEDFNELLLMRIGYGLYFGHNGTAEAQFFYDHRHDDLAGSLAVTETSAGVFGHLGVEGHWWFLDHWGVALQGKLGNALVGQTSIMMRFDTTSNGHAPQERQTP